MNTPIHVTIPEPCHENWQQMTPREQGRFCLSCQKTVVDFSLMTDQEILQYMSTASASVCGRFSDDQLNKTYQEPMVKKVKGWRYAWNMVTAAFLLTANAAVAQDKRVMMGKPAVVRVDAEKPPIKDPVKQVPTKKAVALSGTVTDQSTGNPIRYASVRIKGQEAGVSADSAGRYKLPANSYKDVETLVVSAIGYTTREIDIQSLLPSELTIQLTPQADDLKEVAVKAWLYRSICGRVGGVVSVRQVSLKEKVQRQWQDLLPKSAVNLRVYPNPVVPGNPINISINIKQSGDYRLELLDANGKLVHAQQVQEVQKEQTLNIPTNAAWCRGIYWLRLTSPISKKVYNAKVVIQ